MNKSREHSIQLLKARKNAAIGFHTAKQPLHLVSEFIEFPIVCPRLAALRHGRDHRLKTQILNELPHFISRIGAIHCDRLRAGGSGRFPGRNKFSAFRALGGLT